MTEKVPEQGQLVKVRERFYLVQDVLPHQSDHNAPVIHRVTLECLDDDRLGEQLDVIWEREVHTDVYEAMDLPEPRDWDRAETFEAFLHAVLWSSASMIEEQVVRSPFHAAIQLEEYQLEPVARALVMPRANLLIADDVGLGKTIEAGLVMQELISRRRARRVLIICPASLQKQWQDEMEQKFQLRFEIIDRAAIQRLRKEYGVHVNPWNSFPRLITSMDFLKREQPLRQFRESLQSDHRGLRDWDLLIIDEAHNIAPSGRTRYVRDSDRTRMAREIVDHFEHRLFLTATPHNGFTESFTSLLEMLDPLRFSRGPTVDRRQVEVVMVRRLKDDITNALGERRFPRRNVVPLNLQMSSAEQLAHDDLRRYTSSRLSRLSGAEQLPVNFALTMLKKRLLSSPLAFYRSMETHLRTLGMERQHDDEVEADAKLVEQLALRAAEDWDDDAEKAQVENDALREATRFFEQLTGEERALLDRLARYAAETHDRPDTNAERLLAWVEEHLFPDGRSNGERLIIFTEYLDTLEYLRNVLSGAGYGDALMTLSGGMSSADREAVKTAFQSGPEETPVRILLATDAASEGLNLQNHCRYLIHYEIPWNPNRMEQRNGRIDRHGQRAEEVFVYHFVDAGNEDSRFLQTVVDKVQQMRQDLGSVGDVIAKQVEEAMLGRRGELEVPEERRARVHEEIRAEVMTERRAEELSAELRRARRELDLEPGHMALVLHEALQLHGKTGLEPIDTGERAGWAYWLRDLPHAWRDAQDTMRDKDGRLLAVTFDHERAARRKDVALLHLNHPLMRYALGTFRASLWGDQFRRGQTLHRASYRVLPDGVLSEPVILAWGRLLATSALSQKVHEGLIRVGGRFHGADVVPYSQEELEHLLRQPYEQPPIDISVGDVLRRFFPAHKRRLLDMLAAEEEAERARLMELADERATQEAEQLRQLMNDRIKELRERVKKQENRIPEGQLELFDRDEYLQYEEDLHWLERKLEDLQRRRQSEPEAARRRYELRNVRVFPLGLLYLLPESLVTHER